MWKLKRNEDRKGLEPAETITTSASAENEEPNYYRTRGKDRDRILGVLAGVLWEKVRSDDSKPMPPGLVHALWQRIRDEEYGNILLVALKKVIDERTNANAILLELQRFVWENRQQKKGESSTKEA